MSMKQEATVTADMMKVALYRRGGVFEIADCPRPRPGAGEAVVEIAYCGICGSDLHLVDTGVLRPGCVIGHEISGRIAAVGEGLQDFREGDLVAVMPLDPCFDCGPCQEGNTQLCQGGLSRSYGLGGKPGGFSQFMLVKRSMLFRLPMELDLKTAAINEPWAVAVHGINALDLRPDSLVLVMGAGPIGLLSIYALKSKGIKNIYVSEPDPFRAERARRAGATLALDPKTEKPGTVISRSAGRSPDFVVDCAGSKSSIQEAAEIIVSRGTVLVLGIHMGHISLLPLICFAKEISIRFSFGYNYREFGDCLALLAKGQVAPEVVISDELSLSEIGTAFRLLHEPGHAKILITCH